MEKQRPYLFTLITAACLALFTGATYADTTVTLDQPVHFLTAEGSDVVLDAGSYTVEAADGWLKVTPSEGKTVDALLLEAQSATHEESLTEPLTILVQGETPDVHHLALLLPDGNRFEAIGTYSGIRSRGRSSYLTAARIRALLAARQNTSGGNTEFVTPLYGGGGGRSYNLDCGSGAVMVGVQGKVGMWLDSLGAICQRVNPNGQLGDEFTTRITGGTGGAVNFERCSTGTVAMGGVAYTGSFVEALTLECAKWNPSQKTTGESVGFRSLAPSEYYINTFNPPHSAFTCPASKILKAVRGKSGIYIDSIRFVCDLWNK